MQALGTPFKHSIHLQVLRSTGQTPTTFTPDMRLFLLALWLMSVAGCRCSPPTPQPVTLRVVNSTRSPIYVEGTSGRLGLKIQRDVNGSLFGFDDLACPCRFCSSACTSTCSCPDAGADQVFRIEAGKTAERSWDGVVQVSGFSNCGTEGCLDQQNAPLNERFTLELCFSPQRPSGVSFNDAGVGAGTLPMVTTTCTTKQFAPQDLEVEIGPARGNACTATTECKGTGELCLDGACTTGCPANEFPAVGAEWILSIASPDNMGFFEMSAHGAMGNEFAGTGTLTSVSYQANTLSLSFSRPGPISGERLTGAVQIKLPVGTGAPLMSGRQVSAILIDDGVAMNPSRAFVMKDVLTGEVLLAADMGQDGRLLQPADLGPFKVEDRAVAIGCSQTSCGRLLFFPLRFSAGTSSIELLPGSQGELTIGAGRWSFLNVSSGAYDTTRCPVKDLRPWAFWKLINP